MTSHSSRNIAISSQSENFGHFMQSAQILCVSIDFSTSLKPKRKKKSFIRFKTNTFPRPSSTASERHASTSLEPRPLFFNFLQQPLSIVFPLNLPRIYQVCIPREISFYLAVFYNIEIT